MEILDPGFYFRPACILAGTLFRPVTPGIIAGFFLFLVLLFILSLVSGAEIAFFSLTPAHLKELRSRNTAKNRQIMALLEKPKWLLATVLISINFLNVAIIIVSTYLTSALFDFSHHQVLGFLLQVVVVTVLILFLGEITPKIYATQNPMKMVSLMARTISILNVALRPLSFFLVRSTSLIDHRIAKKGHDLSMSELSRAIEITTNDSTPREEKKLLEGIVKFGDIEVAEIMKSRVDVTAVEISTPYPDLLCVIRESGYSRIPVYRETFDDISGILYIKDLLPHLDTGEDFAWQSLLRKAYFIPENKKINDLLREFQSMKIHLAIVVDEYGGTSGIVTFEDVIEEIVGEISDEFDTDEENFQYEQPEPNVYLFQGRAALNDVCKILEIDDRIFDEVKGESETLAGLILELVGKIPEKNEVIPYRQFEFRIDSADKRRIRKVRVTVKEMPEEQEYEE